MSRLVSVIDASIRAELGNRLATRPSAPRRTLHLLALDDAIEVAGPILSRKICARRHSLRVHESKASSTEYDDLFRRSLGLPTATRYEAGGIFIEHFDTNKIQRETAAYFGSVRTWPIRPRVPLVHRLSPRLGTLISNLIISLPLLRHVGEILLFRASAPIRPAPEGVHRPGNAIVKRLFAMYSRSVGKEPIWRWERIKI